MRLARALEQYMETQKFKEKSAQTKRAYEADLKRLVELASRVSSGKVSDFTKALVEKYFDQMYEKGLKKTTQRRRRAALSLFAQYCLSEELILKNPMIDAPKLKLPKRIADPYEGEDRDRLDTLELTGEDAALRALLRYAGLRANEASHLTWPSVRLARTPSELGVIRVVYGTKGDKERVVTILDELDTALRIHLGSPAVQTRRQTRGLVITNREGGRLTPRAMGKRVTRWGRLANVDRVRPHRFRHTCCTMLFERRLGAEWVQEFMGHEKMDTTLLYRKAANPLREQAFREAAKRGEIVIGQGPIPAELSTPVISLGIPPEDDSQIALDFK